jgi:TPR repeat protein
MRPRTAACLFAIASVFACAANAAIVMPEGSVVPECAAEGRRSCEQACANNDGYACLAASIANDDAGDRESMMQYEQQACRLGVADGCAYYLNNFPDGDLETLETVVEYAEKACDGRVALACRRLGVNILLGRAAGVVLRDPAEALAALDTSCELKHSVGCAMAADTRALGLGIPENPGAAKLAYERECAAGNERACHNATNAATELWTTLPLGLFFESIFTGGPQFVTPDAITPQEVEGEMRFCLEPRASSPSGIAITKSTGIPDLDAAWAETVALWRFRPRPEHAPTRRLCGSMPIRVRFGPPPS